MREARFMGTVTAMAMHDMQNVLAIVRESAGLMGDLLRVNKDVPFKHRDALERAMGHITHHVERGKGILEAMSRLAHATDDNQSERTDLATCCRVVAQLTERLVRMKKAEVRYVAGAPALLVEAGTMPAMAAIFLGLRLAVEQPGPDDRVLEISAENRDGQPVACIRTPGLSIAPADLDGLAIALAGTGAEPRQAGETLELHFPRSGGQP